MSPLATRRPRVLRRIAAACLVLTIISLAASDSSAQYGRYRGSGGYYGRGYYGPRVYNRGYDGGYHGPRIDNRGYGGYYRYPYARPYVGPRIHGGFGYGGVYPY